MNGWAKRTFERFEICEEKELCSSKLSPETIFVDHVWKLHQQTITSLKATVKKKNNDVL